jgi:hypothetical protein
VARLFGIELRGLRGPLTSDFRGYKKAEFKAGDGSLGDSKGVLSDALEDVGVSTPICAVGGSGESPGVLPYTLDCSMSR